MASIRITRNNFIIVNGRIVGKLTEVQQIIFKNNPDLVRKHRLRAIYLGNGRMRFIADWQSILENYFEDESVRNKIKRRAKERDS